MHVFPLQWKRAVQAGVYLVAGSFGFQQFNWSPTSKEWVAATAGLAADQLVALLRDVALRRCAASGGGGQLNERAVWDAVAHAHLEYFEEYELWRAQLQLPDPLELRQQQQQKGGRPQPRRSSGGGDGRTPPPVQLLELALQSLIYAEAANLRHTPHLLFLLYYLARGSHTFERALSAFAATPGGAAPPPLPATHWHYWASRRHADEFPTYPDGCGHDLTSLRRSLLHHLHAACPEAFTHPDPTAAAAAAAAAAGQQQAGAGLELPRGKEQQARALRAAVQALAGGAATRQDEQLVRQLCAELISLAEFGGEQAFLNLVVQPLFFFLAEQIDLAGQQGQEEAALRVAYCDVDEACCSPAAVQRVVAALQAAGRSDLWEALLKMMTPPSGWELSLAQSVVEQQRGSTPSPQPQKAASAGGRAKAWLGRLRRKPPPDTPGESSRYPRDRQRVIILDNLALLLRRSQGEEAARQLQENNEALRHVKASFSPALAHEWEALASVYAAAKHGADWWAGVLFRHKSFVEARSLAAPFVAFWRVYAFHAVLLTAMVAVSFAWRHKAAGLAGWPQVAAALSLSTLADSAMRAARCGAHLLLLSYQRPVVRRQAGNSSRHYTLKPFAAWSWLGALPKLLGMLVWLAWAAALAFALLHVLLQQPLVRQAPQVELWLVRRYMWIVPVLAHVVLVWGSAALRQRPGFVTSWAGALADWERGLGDCGSPPQLAVRSAGARRRAAAAHAVCAADPTVDALFFPASNLRLDARRSAANAALWAATLALKVVFEFACLIHPLTGVMLEILHSKQSFLGAVIESTVAEVASGMGAASRWSTVLVMGVPVLLLHLSDTGLIFSLVGGMASALLGFRRGVGSIKTWTQMVSRFGALLESYKQHCVSRSALRLHLLGEHRADVDEVSISALAAGWNALAADLRQRDLLSNRELACMTFERLQLSEEQLTHLRGVQLTTVLPARCFMAGAVPDLASGAVGTSHQLWAARTCWKWTCWLLYQAGLVTREEVKGLAVLKLLHPPGDRKQLRRWQELLSNSVQLLRLLSRTPSSPSNAAAVTAAVAAAGGAGGGEAAVLAGAAAAAADAAAAAAPSRQGLLHALPDDELDRMHAWMDLTSCAGQLVTLLDKEVSDLMAGLKASSASASGLSGLCGVLSRHPCITHAELELKVAPALRSLTDRWVPARKAVAQAYHEAAAAAAAAGRARSRSRSPAVPRMQPDDARRRDAVLGRVRAVGEASSAVAQVAGWLCDALVLLQGDTMPADDEAVRFVLGFASSLADPGLKTAPAIHAMPSCTTLTPHYDEDVMYALSEDDAVADLAAAAAAAAAGPGAAAAPPPGGAGAMASRDKVVYLMSGDGAPTPTMAYLRSVYCSRPGGGAAAGAGASTQWDNFVERVRGLARARPDVDLGQLPPQVTEFHFLPGEPLHPLKEELLLWASCRGQLLARTVRGMMSYRAALAALADYEEPQLLPCAGAGAGAGGEGAKALRVAVLQDLLDAKYSFVVSSQNLGEFASIAATDLKAAWLVHGIRRLMARHPSFKVAFIDRQLLVRASRPGLTVELRRDASVLLLSEQQRALAAAEGVAAGREAYRVRLPVNFESGRGVILGEGKPENQNHAVIFCHAEALQTIDCNQDNVVAEGLKLRNLLAEFLPRGWDQPPPPRGLQDWLRGGFGGGGGGGRGGGAVDNARLLSLMPKGRGRVALVGFREWVFSEDSGALADFAAATERSFGTTMQRLMHNPGGCRFHYGHPDVWRRSFVATCGGVSKANKALHVSEDVFGGYNVVLRGRDVTYVDYIAVGKGRDMGFETINTFEAKIAAGNGEQVISREIRRLGHNMDFARLMTWYHTGPGFFINTALTMHSVHAALWVLLLLSFEGLGGSSPALQQWLSMAQLLQLGSLSVVVFWVTLSLEVGLFESVWVILRQMLQGSLMFYVFRAQTSASSFTSDLMFGGAKYLPTGRGYKLHATSFKDLWRRFGRSHMYFGAVLLQYCLAVIAAGKLGGAHLLVLWAPMLVVVSLLFGPFWFTPFSFRTQQVMDDLEDLQLWMLSPSLNDSWQSWNKDWWRTPSNASGKQMGRLASCARAHLCKLPTLLLILAVASRFDSRADSKLPKWAVMLVLSAGVLVALSVILAARRRARMTAYRGAAPRVVNAAATVALVGGITASGFATTGRANEFGNALLVFFGMVLLLRLLPLVHYNAPLRRLGLRELADAVYHIADSGLSLLLMGMRFVLSVFDILTGLQAQLLFNTAYARGVMSDSSFETTEVPQLITQALKLQRARRAEVQRRAGGVGAAEGPAATGMRGGGGG